jgi:hypothetical protein
MDQISAIPEEEEANLNLRRSRSSLNTAGICRNAGPI